MPYDDFVRAVPNPQFSLFCNVLQPGFGTILTAFYGENGFCCKAFGIGAMQMILLNVLGYLWFLSGIEGILQWCVKIWVWVHSYLVWKKSCAKNYA